MPRQFKDFLSVIPSGAAMAIRSAQGANRTLNLGIPNIFGRFNPVPIEGSDFEKTYLPGAQDVTLALVPGLPLEQFGRTSDKVVKINTPFNNRAFPQNALTLTPLPPVDELTWGRVDPSDPNSISDWRIELFYDEIFDQSEQLRQDVLNDARIGQALRTAISESLVAARDVWLVYLNEAWPIASRYLDFAAQNLLQKWFVYAVRAWIRRYQELLAAAVSYLDNAETQAAPGGGLAVGGVAAPGGATPPGGGVSGPGGLAGPGAVPPPPPGEEDPQFELLPDDQVYAAVVENGAQYVGTDGPSNMDLVIAGAVGERLYPQVNWPVGSDRPTWDQFAGNASDLVAAAYNQINDAYKQWWIEVFSNASPPPNPGDLPPPPPPPPPATPVPPSTLPGQPSGGGFTFTPRPPPPDVGPGVGGGTQPPPMPPVPTPDPDPGSGGGLPADVPRPLPPRPTPPTTETPAAPTPEPETPAAPTPAPAASSNMMPLVLGVGAVAVLLLMSKRKR